MENNVNNAEKNEENNKLKKKVKKLSISVFILIIATIILAITLVFLVLNDYNENNKTTENKQENNDLIEEENDIQNKVENLDINTKEVSELYSLIKNVEFNNYQYTNLKPLVSYTLEDFLYSRKTTKPIDFNDWEWFGFYIHDFLDFNHFEYEKDETDHCGINKITKSTLQNALYKLFGTNYSIETFTDNVKKFKYIEEEDKYEFNGGCFGDTSVIYVHTKLVRAERKNDYIYLYEKVGIEIGPTNEYYSNYFDYNDEQKTQRPLNEKSIWDYEDDLSTFMYTLKMDSNGEYHLESMEYFEIK